MTLNFIIARLAKSASSSIGQLRISPTFVRTSVSSTRQTPLFLLRQRTGLAYNLCREALNKHNDNVDEAETWLKTQALVHGYQKATKVQGRSTKEGLVCLAVPEDHRTATLVELNCETDFVAKNQNFRDFAVSLTEEIASSRNPDIKSDRPIETVRMGEAELKGFDGKIVPLISKLGENIKLARVSYICVPEPRNDVRIFGEIHAKAAAQSSGGLEITAGRFGAIVAFASPQLEIEPLRLIGKRLCRHVIGYSPQYIELPENVKKSLLEAERKHRENICKSEHDNGDQSDYSDDERLADGNSNTRDDWPSMMDQTLIMSENEVVRDFCKRKNISIIYFDRFECGVEP